MLHRRRSPCKAYGIRVASYCIYHAPFSVLPNESNERNGESCYVIRRSRIVKWRRPFRIHALRLRRYCTYWLSAFFGWTRQWATLGVNKLRFNEFGKVRNYGLGFTDLVGPCVQLKDVRDISFFNFLFVVLCCFLFLFRFVGCCHVCFYCQH